MKTVYIALGAIIAIGLTWFFVWGDFEEWRYSKNMHCADLQNSRTEEICKSIERYQEYKFLGHGIFSFGYRASFVTVKKAWCELSLTENDLNLLKDMQYNYSLPPQLMVGSHMLYGLLYGNLNQNSNLYIEDIYNSSSLNYLLKDGCQK